MDSRHKNQGFYGSFCKFRDLEVMIFVYRCTTGWLVKTLGVLYKNTRKVCVLSGAVTIPNIEKDPAKPYWNIELNYVSSKREIQIHEANNDAYTTWNMSNNMHLWSTIRVLFSKCRLHNYLNITILQPNSLWIECLAASGQCTRDIGLGGNYMCIYPLHNGTLRTSCRG